MKGRTGSRVAARGGEDLIVLVSKMVRPFEPFLTVVVVEVAFLTISARFFCFSLEKTTKSAQTMGTARRTMPNTTNTEIICNEIMWLWVRYGMCQSLSGEKYLYLQVRSEVKVTPSNQQ